ncbi:hypothetical protein AKJ65_00530 [candidate division MSBL1 archaeon SCGC-AAA259E19]|uniref:Phosphate transport regulator n=1 Tax=candidate division MSBL1 archaeon SCGC-AAA259E19 TaxID=1698264 RepID=A0A133UNX6_9EURY|nr:hypothetical protein AKJ65_00530 [candidate division MSBL1 archaeon SCGC-AAA259E19]
MSPEESLSWLGREREERALTLCDEHLSKVVEVADSMRKTFYSFAEDGEEVASHTRKVLEGEKEADQKKAEVLKEVSAGTLSRVSREAIIRMIITADDIAENARAAVEKLSFLDPEDVDEDVRVGLKEISDYACQTVKLLKEAFSISLHDNLEEAINKTEEIEKMEEKVDHFRAENLLPKIIEWTNNSQNPGNSILVMEIESNIEEVVDNTENSADIIREIVIGTL